VLTEEDGAIGRPVGSEGEDGVVLCNNRPDVRIEGRRSRVGWAVEPWPNPETDDNVADSGVESPSFRGRSLFDGLGGGLSPSSPLSYLSLPSPSGSNIFAKFRPTFGELLNRFASSACVGVARDSPVAVRTTPFIAEGMGLLYGRVIGVEMSGKGAGCRLGSLDCCCFGVA